MPKCIFFIVTFFFLFSCKFSNKDKDYQTRIFKLAINPAAESRYYFDIINESEIDMEVSDKKISNQNISTVGLFYTIGKDSIGNYLIQTSYDKIHIKTKNAEEDSEFDAANSSFAMNPVEKMLGVLKGAKISTTITPKGEVKDVKGYKELGEKMVSGFAPNDTYGRAAAKERWEQMIGKELVSNNINQLFKAFPDSGLHIGQQWEVETKQEGQLNASFINTYKLEDVENDIATISVKGTVKNNIQTSGPLNTLQGAITKVSGTQEGEFKVDIKTGILISSEISSEMEGTVQTLGREVPFNVSNKNLIKGRKLN